MERLIKFCISSQLLVLVFAAIIMISGVFSFFKLNIDTFPDVTPTLVQVFTETEGLSPEDIEKYVTYPIEVAMNGLPRLKQVRSVSNFGLSVINIYFEDGADIYFARQVVAERLQLASKGIPDGFGVPQMGPITTGLGQILFYYVKDSRKQYDKIQIRTVQDWIVKFNLQNIPGVTEVLSIGGLVKQYQINVHPEKLLKYNVSLSDVLKSVDENNSNVGAQFIVKNGEEFIIHSFGLAQKVSDLENIVIDVHDGTPIYLKNISSVAIGGEIRRGLTTHNGEGEVVVGMVLKLIGTNTSEVITKVKAKIESINNNLPEGLEIVPYYDQATLIGKSIDTINQALIQGVTLVIIIIFVFMGGFKPSIIAALSIPFSIALAFILMNITGMSANLMSLGGLAIAIGMLVDGSIVIVENIDRLLKNNVGKRSFVQTVIQASSEVVSPIIFSILTIIIVFIPLFTLQGVEGKTFKPLAITITFGMIGSLLYAVIVAPVLAKLLMKENSSVAENKVGWVDKYCIPRYKNLVSYFVFHRMAAVGLVLGMFLIGLAAFPFLGSEFVPRLNEGDMLVRATMPPSISLEEAKKTITRFEKKMLVNFDEVTTVVSRIGRGEVGAHADPVNSAEIFVSLKPKAEWTHGKNMSQLSAAMSEYFGGFPGVKFNFTQPIAAAVDELLTGTRAQLAIKLFGDDLNVLKEVGDQIESVIKNIRGASDVQADQINGSPQLKITIDRDAISRYKLNIKDVQKVINIAIGGQNAGQVFEGTKRFNINVRYAENSRSTVKDIKNIIIASPTGALIPLSNLAKIEEVVGPRQISRENSQRFITIQANVRNRDMGSFVREGQKSIADNIKLPLGYFVTWGGQFELQQQANKRLMVVIPITLSLVFLILFSSFNSLKSASLIFLNIPLAMVGGIIALLISGQNLSVPSSVGFIALFGIALGNGMVLVTYLNKLVMEGQEIDIASINGACMRLRPVLMTAFTTVLGLLPLLWSTSTGSEVQRPLATVVIGGIFTSTILTLLVIPSVYKWFSVTEYKEAYSNERDQGVCIRNI